MLSIKQNILETLKKAGSPDRLVNQFEGMLFFPPSPCSAYVRGNRYRGMAPLNDRFGTNILWPEAQVAAMPHVTPENKVVKDVTRWREQMQIPDLMKNCSDEAQWAPFMEKLAAVDRNENMVMAFMPTGVFERLHFLMGFEDTLTNFLLEPEAMMDLCNAIGEYRYLYMKLIVDHYHPEIMLSHDDWGSKHALFMSPAVWREFIKPQYVKTYKYMKDNGVIIMHHADSFCEPIVEDMIELGIDIWQGVLPQNDIVKLQKQIDGRMVLMGGIDAALVDRADSTEEEIRGETRRACETYGPGGHFMPCITYGAPGNLFPHSDPVITDEIKLYNREVYGI